MATAPLPDRRLVLRARIEHWLWRGLTASVFGATLALCIFNPGAH